MTSFSHFLRKLKEVLPEIFLKYKEQGDGIPFSRKIFAFVGPKSMFSKSSPGAPISSVGSNPKLDTLIIRMPSSEGGGGV